MYLKLKYAHFSVSRVLDNTYSVDLQWHLEKRVWIDSKKGMDRFKSKGMNRLNKRVWFNNNKRDRLKTSLTVNNHTCYLVCTPQSTVHYLPKQYLFSVKFSKKILSCLEKYLDVNFSSNFICHRMICMIFRHSFWRRIRFRTNVLCMS